MIVILCVYANNECTGRAKLNVNHLKTPKPNHFYLYTGERRTPSFLFLAPNFSNFEISQFGINKQNLLPT